MSKVVTAPVRYHMRRVVGAAVIHARPEPPDEMVWDMCSDGDTVQRGCSVSAKEACKLAMAWQKRLE